MSSLTRLASSSLETLSPGTPPASLISRTSTPEMSTPLLTIPNTTITPFSSDLSDHIKPLNKHITTGIIVLVIAILITLVGFGLLLGGIIQATPLFLIIGTSLLSDGVLGILIAALIIGVSQKKKYCLVKEEGNLLKNLLLSEKKQAAQLRTEFCDFKQHINRRSF